MRLRRAVAALAIAATIAGGSAAVPNAAQAAAPTPVPTGASAYSSGLYYTPGTGISASLGVTGAIGALIGPLVNPVLTTVTNTLVTGLIGDGTANNPGLLKLLVTALSSLTSAQASTPSALGATNSYNTTAWLGTGGLAPLINVTSQTVAGYTSSDSSATNNQPMTSYATIASPLVSLFGLPIAQLGTMTAKSVCPTTNSSTSASAATLSTTPSLGTVSLLGGLLSFYVASNNLLMVQVGSLPAVSISQLQQQALSLAGLDVTVASTGSNALRITVQLGLSSLLTALGLGAIGGLTGLSGNTLALTATVGPGSNVVSSNGGTASASGLDIKVGLSGSLGLNILGLVGAAITVAPLSGSADGDLLDLQLGYTACAGGNAVVAGSGTVWYPPGLI